MAQDDTDTGRPKAGGEWREFDGVLITRSRYGGIGRGQGGVRWPCGYGRNPLTESRICVTHGG